MMTAILETDGLTKYYYNQWTFRRFRVLDHLDLQLRSGEIFGLIGPNGAGKTTTFKLLLGLLRPSAGAVRFEGRPLDRAARAAIGFLPEQPYFYDHLRVEETLDFYARLYGIPRNERRQRIAYVIDRLHLGHKRRAALHTLSKGTMQRVGAAQAILHRPRLLILDEPMSGLDPIGRRYLRELIFELQHEGTTVIFSSHILPDTEALCDRVGILVEGQLRDIVAVRRDSHPEAYLLVAHGVPPEGLAKLEQLAGGQVSQNGDRCEVRVHHGEAVRAALELVRQANGSVDALTPVHISLEERFLSHVDAASALD